MPIPNWLVWLQHPGVPRQPSPVLPTFCLLCGEEAATAAHPRSQAGGRQIGREGRGWRPGERTMHICFPQGRYQPLEMWHTLVLLLVSGPGDEDAAPSPITAERHSQLLSQAGPSASWTPAHRSISSNTSHSASRVSHRGDDVMAAGCLSKGRKRPLCFAVSNLKAGTNQLPGTGCWNSSF